MVVGLYPFVILNLKYQIECFLFLSLSLTTYNVAAPLARNNCHSHTASVKKQVMGFTGLETVEVAPSMQVTF